MWIALALKLNETPNGKANYWIILTFCFTSKNLGYWIEQYVFRTRNGNQGIHGQSRVEVAFTESRSDLSVLLERIVVVNIVTFMTKSSNMKSTWNS